ncbi:MAG: hypothetical protein ACR2MD_10120 [Aridibacter sp.]
MILAANTGSRKTIAKVREINRIIIFKKLRVIIETKKRRTIEMTWGETATTQLQVKKITC